MAAEIKSLTDLMKANANLKKASATAKKADPNSRGGGFNDYTGPDGEIVCLFDNIRYINTDKGFFVTLNFTVDAKTDGQKQFAGQRCSIMHSLNDTDRQTAAQGLERYYMDLQLMGIHTPSLSESQIDDALTDVKGMQFKLRAVTGKRDANRKFFNIIGIISDMEHDYSDDSSSETEEWEQETKAPEQDAPDAEVMPSEYLGYECSYRPPKAVKALTFVIVDADDEAMTVTLEREGKKLKNVKWDDLSFSE